MALSVSPGTAYSESAARKEGLREITVGISVEGMMREVTYDLNVVRCLDSWRVLPEHVLKAQT